MVKNRAAIIIFASLSSLYFFSIVHRVGVAVIAFDIMAEFNTDASLLGLMSSMYFFPYALAQIPVGLLLDRIGIRRTVTILATISCIGSLIFSLSPSLLLLSVGRAFVGFGVGGFYVSSLKAIAVWFEPGRFATLAGLLTSIGNLGAIFASYPLAVMSLSLGWRHSFLIISLVMAVLTVVAWFRIKDESKEKFHSKQSISKDLKTVFSYREFQKMVIVPFLVYGLFISFQGLWGGPFLMDVYGMNKSDAGALILFIGLGFMIMSPVAGLISDKIMKRKPVLMVGMVLSLVFWLLMSLLGDSLGHYELMGSFFLLGTSFAFCNIYMTISKELFGSEISGTSMASFNTFNFLGAGFFQYFMGFLLDNLYGGARSFLSYQFIFILATICIVVALIPAIMSKESFRRPEAYPPHQ
ncbi:MAG: MFS transporter [Candidatus Methanomethyliales bacterium]|nr:MFS transporter [Candidatus Methanomethylicales archaeon]